jgi:nicotinamide-nucleotide amidase
MIPDRLLGEAEGLLVACRAKGWRIATAESCTGGLIVAVLTAIPGASDVVDRGFVAYSNTAKNEMLGVPMHLIQTHGAVSEEVVRAMAEGALAHAHADIAVAVTGIAGPTGGSPDKPVGLVCFGVTRRGEPARSERQVFVGDRAAVRAATVAHAFALIRASL